MMGACYCGDGMIWDLPFPLFNACEKKRNSSKNSKALSRKLKTGPSLSLSLSHFSFLPE